MTTKWYLSNTAPSESVPVSPSGIWNQTTGSVQRALTDAPSGSFMSTAISETSATNPFNVRVMRFVSPLVLQSGTFAGDFSLVFTRMANSNVTNDDLITYVVFWAVQVDAVTPANSVNRGVAGSFITTSTWPTTAGALLVANTLAPAVSVDVQPGDHIVVDIGYRARNATTATRTGTVYYGGASGSDLAGGESGATATSGLEWVSFESIDDLFTTPPSGPEPGRMLLSVS